MRAVNIHDATTNLSRLLRRVATGEEVIITRAGKPMARLAPIDSAPPAPTLGADVGRFEIPPDFDRELSAELIAAFEGRVGVE